MNEKENRAAVPYTKKKRSPPAGRSLVLQVKVRMRSEGSVSFCLNSFPAFIVTQERAPRSVKSRTDLHIIILKINILKRFKYRKKRLYSF